MKDKLTVHSQVTEKGDAKKAAVVEGNLTKYCYVKKGAM